MTKQPKLGVLGKCQKIDQIPNLYHIPFYTFAVVALLCILKFYLISLHISFP